MYGCQPAALSWHVLAPSGSSAVGLWADGGVERLNRVHGRVHVSCGAQGVLGALVLWWL